MKPRHLLTYGSAFAGLLISAACVPQQDSLAKIDPYEADPVQTEIWSPSIYTGAGSTHGVTAPRTLFGLGPRASSVPLALSDQVTPKLRELNWQNVNERVSKFGTESSGGCARGVKNSLSMLLGIPNVEGDGVDACEVTETYLNKKFSRKGQFNWKSVPLTEVAKSGLKPGDVIACNRDLPGVSWEDSIPCESGQWDKLSGHIEFVDGAKRLSSDFKQRGSGCLSNSRYQLARVYRMDDSTAMAMIPFYSEQIFGMFLNSAHAADGASLSKGVATSTAKTTNHVILAKTDEYAVYEEDIESDGTQDSSAFVYSVYHKQNNRWIRVSKSDLSSFHAVEGLSDKTGKNELAKQLVKQAIKEYGRERLQQKILTRVMFSSCEKDAYINEGFKIPEFFKITQ